MTSRYFRPKLSAAITHSSRLDMLRHDTPYTHTYTHIYIYRSACINTHTCIYIRVYACMRVYTYIGASHAYIHKGTSIHP